MCILRVSKNKNPADLNIRLVHKDRMHMKENIIIDLPKQAPATCQNALDELVRQGAQQMLQRAIENEVAAYLERYADQGDEKGHRLVVRNGRLPQRQIRTAAGPVEIHQGRVDDQRPGQKFVSQLLPPYLRRTASLDALVPALYLRGISSGDFTEALSAILGPNAAGLSATNILRLKEGWQDDYEQWQKEI